jgi:poly(hydroxyalkanoate) granule-associated protein
MTKNIKELEQEEEELSRAVRSSAQQIWQAGLGAFAKAQQAGGREFTRLVRDGSELQKRARQVEDATDTVARKAERSSRRASSTWGKLEQVFEERVARALATIGVPARSEMEALNHRIDELERMVAELAGEHLRKKAAQPAPTKAAAARPPAKRAAAKGGTTKGSAG